MFSRLTSASLIAAGCLAAGLAAPISSAAAAPTSSGLTRTYVVTLADGVDAGVASAALSALGGGDTLFVYREVLNGFAVRLPTVAADLLRAAPGVVSLREAVTVTTAARKPAFRVQKRATWGLDRSDQRTMRTDGRFTYPAKAGSGAHVYVIDTGIDPDHSEFRGRIGASRNFVASGGLLGLGGGVDPDDWQDCNGHGTHVASTATGATFGVAKRATVHAVRVLGCNGSGDEAGILAGIEWVAANHQRGAVANLSIGTNVAVPSINQAVNALMRSGVAVAVAAGNEDRDACGSSPASAGRALTVGATDSADRRAAFSNFGSCVDVFAPGVGITGADADSDTGSIVFNGTSMASPHVAGALALLRADRPKASAKRVQQLLLGQVTRRVVKDEGTGSPRSMVYVARSR